MEYLLIPVGLFGNDYMTLTNDAKIAYALISNKLAFFPMEDEEGNKFVHYRLEELERDLNCSGDKVRKIKRILIENGLIKEKRPGLKEPNRYYVFKP
ncbi:replication initiator protein A [Virgibacillus sp. AGTR]|uniref:replication initiator protein A n=1 Tax=Virgibacillus sp. AGTR TaxID=2812055 RepID=UPI001D15EC20|nr:replication initiator protein A [Virgibacillus sp. AGTR]MCC2248996.1 replication initiator protein A [Virgibacillus sp. AGTR]